MLYAHAIALEREAAARYAQLSERMAALGEAALGDVFTMLSGFEDDHLDTLLRRTDGVPIPDFDAVPWPAGEGPETAAREFDATRATPREARWRRRSPPNAARRPSSRTCTPAPPTRRCARSRRRWKRKSSSTSR